MPQYCTRASGARQRHSCKADPSWDELSCRVRPAPRASSFCEWPGLETAQVRSAWQALGIPGSEVVPRTELFADKRVNLCGEHGEDLHGEERTCWCLKEECGSRIKGAGVFLRLSGALRLPGCSAVGEEAHVRQRLPPKTFAANPGKKKSLGDG